MRQKTYWHLQDKDSKPDPYSIVSEKLLYYRERGFEVNTPIGDWYKKYQSNAEIKCTNWELFRDPRATTYASYTKLQADQEKHVSEIFETMESTQYDSKLPSPWLSILENTLPILRYPYHAIMMIASYNAQMAPSSQLVIAFTFQAADEMRCVHQYAYRMCQLKKVRDSFGSNSLQQWEQNPSWQGLRKLVERLLATYSWDESFVILNYGLKPLLHYMIYNFWLETANRFHDVLFTEVLYSLQKDSNWHQQWSQDLLKILLAEGNKNLIQHWLTNWRETVLDAFIKVLPNFSDEISNQEKQENIDRLIDYQTDYLKQNLLLD